MFRYSRKLGMADIVIQGMLLALILMSILGLAEEDMAVLFILIFQFFLGVYQLASGIVGAVKRRKWKAVYLGVAVAYLIIGGFSAVLLEEMRWGNDLVFVLMIIVGIVVPLLIGVGYFILSVREFNNSKPVESVMDKNAQLRDDDILDDLLDE